VSVVAVGACEGEPVSAADGRDVAGGGGGAS